MHDWVPDLLGTEWVLRLKACAANLELHCVASHSGVDCTVRTRCIQNLGKAWTERGIPINTYSLTVTIPPRQQPYWQVSVNLYTCASQTALPCTNMAVASRPAHCSSTQFRMRRVDQRAVNRLVTSKVGRSLFQVVSLSTLHPTS